MNKLIFFLLFVVGLSHICAICWCLATGEKPTLKGVLYFYLLLFWICVTFWAGSVIYTWERL